MKLLKTREEIAKAINFGKYPVIDLDLEKQLAFYDEVYGYEGCSVRVPFEHAGETYYATCRVNYLVDNKNISFVNETTIISNEFGASDIMEMVDRSHMPIIDKDQEIVLVVHSKKGACVSIIKTSNKKDIHCSSVLATEDIDIIIKAFE